MGVIAQLFSCCGLARILFGWLSSPKSEKLYDDAMKYYNDYLTSNDPADLENALKKFKSALSVRRKEENTDVADILVNYAVALWMEYERDGRPTEALKKIIEFDEEALDLWKNVPAKPEGYPVLLLNLASAYFDQYMATRDAASFDRAVELYDELKTLTSAKKETRTKGLMMLGKALNTRCDFDKKTDRLDESIGLLKEALDLTKPSKEVEKNAEGGEAELSDLATVQIECLYNLATAYEIRWRLNEGKRSKDLDKAIEYNYEVRGLITEGHPNRAPCLYNLARLLFARYERAQKGKMGQELLDVNLDLEKGIPDLKAADKIAREAQNLLSGDNAPNLQPLKERINALLGVIGKHEEGLSRRTGISGSGSSISTGRRSKEPSPQLSNQSLRDKA